MIPDHALSKAIRAYDANTGFPAVFPLALEAAIETVAAEIWDQGYEVGEGNGYAIGRDIDWVNDQNPYRNENA